MKTEREMDKTFSNETPLQAHEALFDNQGLKTAVIMSLLFIVLFKVSFNTLFGNFLQNNDCVRDDTFLRSLLLGEAICIIFFGTWMVRSITQSFFFVIGCAAIELISIFLFERGGQNERCLILLLPVPFFSAVGFNIRMYIGNAIYHPNEALAANKIDVLNGAVYVFLGSLLSVPTVLMGREPELYAVMGCFITAMFFAGVFLDTKRVKFYVVNTLSLVGVSVAILLFINQFRFVRDYQAFSITVYASLVPITMGIVFCIWLRFLGFELTELPSVESEIETDSFAELTTLSPDAKRAIDEQLGDPESI